MQIDRVAIIAAHQSLSVIESSQQSRRKDTVQNEVIRRAVKPASKGNIPNSIIYTVAASFANQELL